MPVLTLEADLHEVQLFLRREPVLNTVPLGLVSRALAVEEERAKLFVATVEQGGEIVAAAFRSDFPKLTLAAGGTRIEIVELARIAYSHMPDLPCVLGRDGPVDSFAAEWTRLTGSRARAGMRQRLHVLDRVRNGPGAHGAMRPARPQDLEIVLDWFGAFEAEAVPAEARPATGRREAVRQNFESGSFFLWLDPEPVSMAGARQFGEGVARVGPVFTPVDFRRRGFAGALTAAVSQHVLDHDCVACCLFTDLGNPTSNHIYREVGYEQVADFNEFWFDKR